MRTKIIGFFSLSSLIFSLALFANELEYLELEDTSLHYSAQEGSISIPIARANLGDYNLSLRDYLIDIKKENDEVLLENQQTSLTIKRIENSIINSISHLSLENLDLSTDFEDFFDFSITSGEFELGDGIQSIGELHLECKNLSDQKEAQMPLLNPCLELGKLYIPELNLSELSKGTVANIFPLKKRGKEPEVLKEINLQTHKGNYSLQLKTKFIFNLKLKMQGQIKYQEEEKRIVISVHKAKVGWISVKKKVLKEIREAEIKNVQVFGSNIIINL